MPEVGEVRAQIDVTHARLVHDDRLRAARHRVRSGPFRALAIRSWLKVSFEDRFQDEFYRTLDTASTNRGDRKKTNTLAACCRYLPPA